MVGSKGKRLIHKASIRRARNTRRIERIARCRVSKAVGKINGRGVPIRNSNGVTGRNLPKPITNTGGNGNNGNPNNS